MMELSLSTHLCICFSLTYLLFSLPCYSMLYPWLYVLYHPACAASHSLISKCWHISFKCTVFISHSLCPSPILPISVLSLRRIWICLGGINPQTSTAELLLFLSSLLSSPLLLPQLSHPTFIVNDWVSASIWGLVSHAALWFAHCTCLFISFSVKPVFFFLFTKLF